MCLIVDACCAAHFFRPANADFAPAWKWLQKDGALVYGGKLLKELNQNYRAAALLAQLKRAGRAFEISGSELSVQMNIIDGRCASNDSHIVALARASGARVLVSSDRLAIKDFKNLSLVPSPKGKVYTLPKHQRVLRHSPGCKRSI